MKCSKIYIGIKSLTNFDIKALNSYNIANGITDCTFVSSDIKFFVNGLSNIKASTNVFIRKPDEIDINIAIQATEDANISNVCEMTFTDEHIYFALKRYLEHLGIKVNLLDYSASNEESNSEQDKTCKLSGSARKRLIGQVIKKFKSHEPEADSIQYSTLCNGDFANELGLEKLGYNKIVDLIEDLDYFIVERQTYAILIKFPPHK